MHDSVKWSSDNEFLLNADNYFTDGTDLDRSFIPLHQRCTQPFTQGVFLFYSCFSSAIMSHTNIDNGIGFLLATYMLLPAAAVIGEGNRGRMNTIFPDV